MEKPLQDWYRVDPNDYVYDESMIAELVQMLNEQEG